jgi:hypothetical protein
MRRGTSIVVITAAAAALAVGRYSAVPPEPSFPTPPLVSTATPKHAADILSTEKSKETTPCKAYLGLSGSPKESDGDGEAFEVWRKFARGDTGQGLNLTFAIALVPDPVHTHLSLAFDRAMAAVQAGAQDESYDFDSSWLPWQLHPSSFPLRIDERQEKKAIAAREGCPGLLLFRNADVTKKDYADALVVLVVGEQPTAGINQLEWNCAISLIQRRMQPAEDGANLCDAPSDKTINSGSISNLRILGPTFSGSFTSLVHLLEPNRMYAFGNITILSGGVGSCKLIHDFEAKEAPRLANDGMRFAVFGENDERKLYRLLHYLELRGERASDVAIISEDETAYGASALSLKRKSADRSEDPNRAQAQSSPVPDPCNYLSGLSADLKPDSLSTVNLFYPRDISALRTAYQEQSLLGGSPGSGVDAAPYRTALRSSLEDSASGDADTIRSYSGQQTALDQEAELYELVSFLRAHHTRYLVLRCTNTLDDLFLTRFFRRTYPEGQIITMGSEDLFRREVDTSEFRGTMMLSNFPLIPRQQHWARLSKAQKDPHRVFATDVMEGTYIAARFLLDQNPETLEGITYEQFGKVPTAAHFNHFKENIPEYADPFWQHAGDAHPSCTRPPTWLAAVGVDGNWPIALLQDPKNTHNDLCLAFGKGAVLGTKDSAPPPISTLATLEAPSPEATVNGQTIYRSMIDWHTNHLPRSWLIYMWLLGGLIVYHMIGLWAFSGHAFGIPPGVRPLFHPLRMTWGTRQNGLFGLANAILMATGFLVIAGGWRNYRPWKLYYGSAILVLFTGFLLVAIVVVTASLIIRDLAAQREDPAPTPRIRWLRSSSVWFIGGLFLFLGPLVWLVWSAAYGDDHFSLIYRSVHLGSGISPVLPFLFLLTGQYIWVTFSLRGLRLLALGPMCLPAAVRRGRQQPDFSGETGHIPYAYRRVSATMGATIQKAATSLQGSVVVVVVMLVAIVLVLSWSDASNFTLEGRKFSLLFSFYLLIPVALILIETVSFHETWRLLRCMLIALAQLRLRRTFKALHDMPSSSIWALGEGARAEQIRSLADMHEALRRLRILLLKDKRTLRTTGKTLYKNTVDKAYQLTSEVLDHDNPLEDAFANRELMKATCRAIRVATEDVYNFVLLREWETETNSLDIVEQVPPGSAVETAAHRRDASVLPKPNESPLVLTAEEFVCDVYLAFIKKILNRMRMMACSIAALFFTLGGAISLYPLGSRPTIVLAYFVLLVGVFTAVVMVYAGMERDEILSYITGGAPGELSSEFWLKILGFGVGPLVGLLAAQFPSLAQGLFSWLQPGIAGMK